MRMRGWRPAPEPTLPATGSRENMKAGEDARGARGEGPRKLGLCVLCGLPAAGKSTFARALSHQLRLERGWAAGVVAYDDVMPDAFLEKADARPLPSQWKLLRQELLKYLEYFLLAVINGCQMATPPSRTEAMWEDFITCLKEQDLISSAAPEAQSCYLLTKTALFRPLFLILDDNFYYQSMRYEVYQLARKYSLGFCQLFLDCSLETCLQRNGQRPRPLPAETIHLMGRKIEEPNPEKNAWEHNSLTIQSPACASEPSPELTDLLLTALENPVKYVEDNVEQKETDRTICSTNILHQADQALRRIVSQAMKEAKGHLESKHVVLVRMWVDQSPQALLVGISDGTAALETACQFLQQLSVLLPWDPAILPLDEQVLPYNLKLLAEELNKLKAELLEDLREGNRKYLCFQQTIDVSDVISFFHYEKDNIVRKYFSKQH